MDTPKDTRSLSELLHQLIADATALARAEMDAARAEMAERSGRFTGGIGLVAGAALFAVIAIGCLAAAAVAALALVMPTWLAAVIVALAALLIAAILALVGRGILRRAGSPLPVNSIASAKEDVAWVKAQTQTAAK